MNKRTSKKKRATKSATEVKPHCYVENRDGVAGFALEGVHPNPNGTFTIYLVVARVLEGVRDCYIVAESDHDCEIHGKSGGNQIVNVTIPEAVALFLDPIVERTLSMPESALAPIRWFENRGRRTGEPHRCQDMIRRPMTDAELEANARDGRSRLARATRALPISLPTWPTIG